MMCVGLNPSPTGEGPGINNEADKYHANNFTEISASGSCGKCVRKHLKGQMPPYSRLNWVSSKNCHGFVNGISDKCKDTCS